MKQAIHSWPFAFSILIAQSALRGIQLALENPDKLPFLISDRRKIDIAIYQLLDTLLLGGQRSLAGIDVFRHRAVLVTCQWCTLVLRETLLLEPVIKIVAE